VTQSRSYASPLSGLIATLLVFAIVVQATGCVTRHTFKPETFDVAEQGDIQVFTMNRRMIEFGGGKYTVGDSSGLYFLTGNGIEHRPDSLIVRVPYSGRLPFAAIDRIETVKMDVYSTLYVTLFIGFFATIGFLTDITD